jgi:hypothetical protein
LRIKLILAALLLVFVLTACRHSTEAEAEILPPSDGQIFLYGESHGNIPTMNRQLEIWRDYYQNHGMRHLFIETPYFTAQFLNMWMQAEDDTILYQLYDDWRDTPMHNPHTLVFYRTIKNDFPETVFHGSDVGHTSDTAGERYIQFLTDNGLQGTEAYQLTRENIAQYQRYRREGTHAVRAYYKPQNFIRAFDALRGQDVMAIHGWYHVDLTDSFMGLTGVPSMAFTLRERYGDNLHTFNMLQYAQPQRIFRNPERTDMITINDVPFEASYFGIDETPRNQISKLEFWRLENAYDHFRGNPPGEWFLPFDNFPMEIEIGQAFIVDIHWADGSVERQFYRSDGDYWDNRPSTVQFFP